MHIPCSTRDMLRVRPARDTRLTARSGRRGIVAALIALTLAAAAPTPGAADPAPAASSGAAPSPGAAATASAATASPGISPLISHSPAATVTSSTPAHHSYCGIVWGSLPRTNGTTHTTGTVQDVRAGRHTCFDRLVIDVGAVPGRLTYAVRYVDTVRHDGSGRALPLAGGAALQVVVRAPAVRNGAPGYSPSDPGHLVTVHGWNTFRQVALAGSFEGQTTVGLGVRARLPFRAFVLDGPGDGARLVVDVAHRW